jgi:hypothetical protein
MTSRARSGIGAWLCLSATLCLAVIVSSRSDPSELGAPVYWTWALTGLQVMALWVAGRGQAWGWMVGSAVQPGWIAYALMTDQLGFVIGCGISTGVQLSAYGQWSDRQSRCRSRRGASRFSIRAPGRSQIRYALYRSYVLLARWPIEPISHPIRAWLPHGKHSGQIGGLKIPLLYH